MTAARRNVRAIAPRVTTEIIHVTPQMAEAWLASNTVNRRMSATTITKYGRDMQNGRWQLTGESVKFSTDGQLLDGQHRLAAIVWSGITVPLFVTRNVPAAAQQVMDSGRARTAADALALRGEKNTALAAATARLALAVAAGESPGGFSVTHSEILQFLDENPDIWDAVHFAQSVFRRTDCLPTVVAYTTWRLSHIDADEAERFWTDAAEKVGLAPGDPILALTRRLAEGRRVRERFRPEALVAGVFRTWNARRRGQRMQRLQLSKAGESVAMVEPVPR